jgi:hypothetical protein
VISLTVVMSALSKTACLMDRGLVFDEKGCENVSPFPRR